MQTINWIEHEEKGTYKRPNLVAYVLLEAMAKSLGEQDLKEYFAPFKPEALQVELTVNGKVVNFVHAMNLIQDAISDLEDEIRSGILKDAANRLIAELQSKVDEQEFLERRNY